MALWRPGGLHALPRLSVSLSIPRGVIQIGATASPSQLAHALLLQEPRQPIGV